MNYNTLVELIETNDDLVIVDVRTPQEYFQGCIPGSINIPVETVPEGALDHYKNKKIVLYCLSGGRSGAAEVFLKGQGFNDVTNFGSVQSWEGDLELN